MNRTIAKRYVDPEEYSKYETCKDNVGGKKLPFYDTVRKNVAGFDVGLASSCRRKLRAIGFESWYGVGNGWVSAFRSRFESSHGPRRTRRRDGALNMNENSSRVGNDDANAERSDSKDASDVGGPTKGPTIFTSTLQTILNVIPNIKAKRSLPANNKTCSRERVQGESKVCGEAPQQQQQTINLDDVRLVRRGAKRSVKGNGCVSVGVGLVLLPPWLTHSTQLIRWKAESKKEEGNEAYKRKQYEDALGFYSEAIDLSPRQASYYGNRAACYLMMGKMAQALDDARQAVKLDPSFVKGYLRESKCHLALGDLAAAERALQKAQPLEPKNKSITLELNQVRHLQNVEKDIQKALGKKDYRTAVYYLEQAITSASACTKFKLMKAECLVYLSRYQESQDIVYDIMRADSSNVDAIYVRGLGLYYQDNVEKAFTHFQQALRLEPDHVRAKEAYRRAKTLKQKKEEGNEAFRTGRLVDACDLYTKALQIDPDNVFTNAKLYFNRAIVYAKLNKLNQAIDDCSQAIKLDANYTKAYLKRAKCYMDTQMYEEAVRDYEKVCKIDKSRENRQLLQDAKLELKKSKRKDYYKILGIGRNATDDDIKKAYRKRALEHHPDRHSSASDEIKKEQEKKFKDLGEAYSILSDPKQRSRYDNGHDMDDMDFGHDFDPTTIFQTFGGPGGQFNFGGGNSFPFSFKFA